MESQQHPYPSGFTAQVYQIRYLWNDSPLDLCGNGIFHLLTNVETLLLNGIDVEAVSGQGAGQEGLERAAQCQLINLHLLSAMDVPALAALRSAIDLSRLRTLDVVVQVVAE